MLLFWTVGYVAVGLLMAAAAAVITVQRRRGRTTPSGRPLVRDRGERLFQLVGGANLPTRSMRIDATYPLAALDVHERGVHLALRPWTLLGIPLDAAPADLDAVYPVRRRLASAGLAFRLTDGREWYFWTRGGRSRQSALEALERLGFPVRWEPQRATKAWTNRP